ncbi:MAG: hypothetical protein ABSH35_31675 [Isosphaeraceae bacterium]
MTCVLVGVLAFNSSAYYAARTFARDQRRWLFLQRPHSSLQATAQAVSGFFTMNA